MIKTEINLEDYLEPDELKRIAERVAESKLSRWDGRMEVLLSNASYDIVKRICHDKLGVDAVKKIGECVERIASDESVLKHCLMYDDASIHGIGRSRGMVLKIAEDYLKEKCVEKVRSVVDKILDGIKFDAKRFESMVIKETARLVAEKLVTKEGAYDGTGRR